MKVGIVTLDGHFNYGNRLQNYALSRFVSELGCDVKTLWKENFVYCETPESILNFKNIVKYLLDYKDFRKNNIHNRRKHICDVIRQNNIKKFSDNYIIIDYSTWEPRSNSQDYVIVGSDQVWNPFFINDNLSKNSNEYFLKKVDGIKRIAYSASFGISELPNKYKELFKQGLNGIRHISVREEAGAKIVKELTGRDVPVLVDPTLLLSKEEWQCISMEPEWYRGEKYILTYFLGDVPQIIKQLADKYGYKIYNLMDREDLNLYTSRVEEFLWLIEHTQLVCTDSFHACVFSIIFNTPFLVVNRKQAGVADMTSRLDTLMKLFGYQDRFIDFNNTDINFDKIMTMDFSRVVEIQDRERQRSLKFLKDAMNLE